MLVRSARESDFPDLQRIFRAASLSNAGDRQALLAHPQYLELDPGLIGRGRTQVATHQDGTVIAFASTSRKAAGVLELDDLFTEPAWRRRGAARRLIEAIVADAHRERVARLDVVGNQHAMAFYRRVGFVPDGPARTALGGGVHMHLAIGASGRRSR